jgi:RND family efflux transporter MFP subunit
VIGGVSERHLALLVPGRTTARVAADAYPDEVFEGVVFRVGPEVDRRMRTVEVELRIPNPQHLLKPGMFTRLRLELDRREGVTVVPAAAIIHHEGKDLACVVIDGRARRRLLKLGLSEGDRHEVLEGLLPGDVVIVRGQRMVKEGDEVRCVNEAGGTSEDTTAGEQTVLEEPGR